MDAFYTVMGVVLFIGIFYAAAQIISKQKLENEYWCAEACYQNDATATKVTCLKKTTMQETPALSAYSMQEYLTARGYGI